METTRGRVWLALRRESRFWVGSVIFLATVLVAVFAPFMGLSPYHMTAQALLPPFHSMAHILGTDSYGRDLLSRILLGAQVSVAVGLGSVLIAVVIGTGSGIIAAYLGGFVDTAIMRVMDTLLAFPPILAAIVLVGVLGPGIWNVVLGIGVVYIPVFARIARAKALSVSRLQYVEAARSVGASDLRVMARHILPNVMGPVLVQATVAYAFAIVAEAGLSFLGLGVQPPTPSWGSILSEARSYIETQPWFAMIPGVTLAVSVLGITLLGDALRDVLDPKRM